MTKKLRENQRIAVVIPCFKARPYVLSVIEGIGRNCWRIYIVDDACPEHTGQLVEQMCTDPRVHVLYHAANKGVGGAVMTGYKQAIEDGAKLIVKIDADGQHNPALMDRFCQPILAGKADYTKGNRFYDFENIGCMPRMRLFGNAALSFFSKLSSGYWDIFDPTNGYTAIHAEIVRKLPLTKIDNRFFFESDILFRLNTIRAVVVDIPMRPIYSGETSNLVIRSVAGEFLIKHCANFLKRIFYNYFLRDMSIASIELVAGLGLIIFGLIFGLYHWSSSMMIGTTTPAGTVMLSALPLILGLQFLLAFLAYDIASVPKRPRIEGIELEP